VSKPPVAGLVDRPDGEPASSQGDAITPLDVKTAAGIFTELLTTRDAKTGEPVPADATPEEAPAVSAAPSVADAVAAIPELEEVQPEAQAALEESATPATLETGPDEGSGTAEMQPNAETFSGDSDTIKDSRSVIEGGSPEGGSDEEEKSS